MAMTDEQFRELINVITSRQADHDLLIEIRTIVKMNNETFEKERIETATKIGLVDKIASAAHKRIDFIFGGVVLSVGGMVIAVVTFFFTHKPSGS